MHQALREMETEMLEAADALEFERAAILRDQIREMKSGAGLAVTASESKAGSCGGARPYRSRRVAAAARRLAGALPKRVVKAGQRRRKK